jgi:hypothetical protein
LKNNDKISEKQHTTQLKKNETSNQKKVNRSVDVLLLGLIFQMPPKQLQQYLRAGHQRVCYLKLASLTLTAQCHLNIRKNKKRISGPEHLSMYYKSTIQFSM